MDNQALETYQQLISEFDELPEIPPPKPTILEIAGFPHYEEVISNILRFFFRADRGHGLSEIFIESLLSAAGKDIELDPSDLIVTAVDREVTTQSGKRIDLIVVTETSAIAIENKIYAKLYNDLSDYKEFAKSAFSDKDKIELIILSLRKLEKPKHSEQDDFVLVTYREFFNEIEQRLGKVMPGLDSKHLIYLSDFINTIRNLNKMTTLETAHLNFLKNNKEKIEALYQLAYKTFKDQLQSLAKEIDTQLEDKKNGFSSFHLSKTDSLEYVQGYKKNLQYDSMDIEIQIKVRLEPQKVTIELWSTEAAAKRIFHKFVKNKLPDKKVDQSQYPNHKLSNFTYQKFHMDDTDKKDLVDEISELMYKLE